MSQSAPATTHPVRTFLIGAAATALILTGLIVTGVAFSLALTSIQRDSHQATIAPFYLPPAGWQDHSPGSLLRSERINGVPAGGIGWRILYVTQRADGARALSSGMVFAPGRGEPPIPAGGRPVVAWAHPTVGMGASCAPSRTENPSGTVSGLADFLRSGWVVAATDYAGLGTPGITQYLVGAAEAHDVLNSVRAARQIAEAGAGRTVAVWGHSQGGHAALWTADDRSYAPELHVIAAAAAAPAAELPVLISHQWNTLYGSLIGAEVLVSYPASYPDLRADEVSARSMADITGLAHACVVRAAVDLVVASAFGRSSLLDKDPLRIPAWSRSIAANTPPPPDIPTIIVQGLADPIVLPGSTAAYLDHACAMSAPISGVFIGGLGHVGAGKAAAPLVSTWLQQRFAHQPAPTTCGTRLPIAPLRIAER